MCCIQYLEIKKKKHIEINGKYDKNFKLAHM